MIQISERTINSLTRRHIARLLKKFEEKSAGDLFFIRQEVKKEFWLHNQNLKQALYDKGLIDLDDTEKPWIPKSNEI